MTKPRPYYKITGIKERPLILATNDDGFRALGLRALAEGLAEIGEVVVVAPDRERSAAGHAVTLAHPLRAWEEEWPGGGRVFVVDGTPADCVKIGVKALCPEPPAVVVSGINRGGNYGVNVLYSGTVSAASEAALLGIPALAVSLNTFRDADLDLTVKFAKCLVEKIISEGLPPGVALNVNVPALPREKIAGVRVTRQSAAALDDYYEERVDPRGRRYFWLAAERIISAPADSEYDLKALEEGFISITPLHYDLTDYDARMKIMSWEKELWPCG